MNSRFSSPDDLILNGSRIFGQVVKAFSVDGLKKYGLSEQVPDNGIVCT
jgi:hypothetical protein